MITMWCVRTIEKDDVALTIEPIQYTYIYTI